jgi:hypothetical protein
MTVIRSACLAACLSLLVLAAGEAPAAADLRFQVELEGGPVWQTRNDVRIPNDTGTEFSLVDLIGSGPSAAGRGYLTWDVAPKSSLRLLIAPLSIQGEGTLPDSVRFAGETFAPGVVTDATYKFNSYRLSYRYLVHDGARWQWRIGLTGKIRDARIALAQPGTQAEKTDLGFVPLLNLNGLVTLSPRLRLELDADGLAAPQGRAFDVALKGRYELGPRVDLAVGYRTLEGGADVDAAYTFAWLHYAVASVAWRF